MKELVAHCYGKKDLGLNDHTTDSMLKAQLQLRLRMKSCQISNERSLELTSSIYLCFKQALALPESLRDFPSLSIVCTGLSSHRSSIQ
jgi:hypothetical protein